MLQYDKFRQKPKFDSFSHTLMSSKLAKTVDFVILSKAKNLLWLISKFSEKIIRHSLFECFFF